MLRLTRLKTYTKQIRRNARTGETEVEALDVQKRNPMKEIQIPVNGYILKAGEIYVAEVNNPSSEGYVEKNFVEELTALGVSCKIVEDECILTVQRPVRIYHETGLFYEDNRRFDKD